MKKNVVKRVLAVSLSAVLAIGALAGCGKGKETEGEVKVTVEVPEGKGGTIMWLTANTSGLAYESALSYLNLLCEKLGYNEILVAVGDGFNDPAGNLQAVKNAMTDDVVGLIASADGGILDIMQEYPDLYVAGYNNDMASVYGGNGTEAVNAACLENDHFLGTICDGKQDGADMAQVFFDTVVAEGYKDIAVVNFPAFAFANQGVADATFTSLVEEYNKTADEKINIVGETTTLMFAPLEDSWFLEEGRGDLDCIVAMCSGIDFVYATMVNAMANGTCSADTKMITGGFSDDEDIVAAIGDDEDGKVITMTYVAPAEDPAYALVLLDNAINEKQYADFKAECVDSFCYMIDSTEDIENVMEKSMLGTGDRSLAQLTADEVLSLCVRVNPDATFADLKATFSDESKISVDALAD